MGARKRASEPGSTPCPGPEVTVTELFDTTRAILPHPVTSFSEAVQLSFSAGAPQSGWEFVSLGAATNPSPEPATSTLWHSQ